MLKSLGEADKSTQGLLEIRGAGTALVKQEKTKLQQENLIESYKPENLKRPRELAWRLTEAKAA
jgi:hypothetical protein